jgi:hypothetical protein
MPKRSRTVIKEINGEKVVVINTLNGSVVLGQQVAKDRAEKRKITWRSLSSFKYPTENFVHDFSVNFASHLVFHLHRTFRNAGFTKFTSLIETDSNTLGNSVTVINLISQHANYTGAIRSGVKALWDESRDRVALQEEQKAELLNLQNTWSVAVGVLPTRNAIVAYEFIYDPDDHVLSIKPSQGSTDPADYPNQVTQTSELLSFVAAQLNTQFAVVDFPSILRSYPLSKLMLELLDQHGITIENIRVDVAGPEEWDYVNVAADRELGKIAKHRDYSKD